MKRGPGRPRKVTPDADENLLVKSAELFGWALGGLEREIAETRERLTTLTGQAMQLRDRLARSAGIGRASAAAGASAAQPATRRRNRRKLSKEQRRAISERMKKRWAERKTKSSK